MKTNFHPKEIELWIIGISVAAAILVPSPASAESHLVGGFHLPIPPVHPKPPVTVTNVPGYEQINLVGDVASTNGSPKFADTNLVNPWGLFVWAGTEVVADNGQGVATFYRAGGKPAALVVTIPTPAGSTNPAAPSGVAVNTSTNFVLTQNHKSGRSEFIFVTEEGTISGWNQEVNASNALMMVDNSTNNAIYKGAAFAWTTNGPALYVSNFKSGKVEMYGGDFKLIKSFTDTNIASGYAPFGVHNIDGHIFVTYAKRKAPDNHDDEAGPGNGYVDIFDREGNLERQLAARGALNSPWAVAEAPEHFGKYHDAILVGNFGDGHINAYDPLTGDLLGQLNDTHGNVIQIEGLWALSFPSFDGERSNSLYFTAGPGDESHGLLGILQPSNDRHNDDDHDGDDNN